MLRDKIIFLTRTTPQLFITLTSVESGTWEEYLNIQGWRFNSPSAGSWFLGKVERHSTIPINVCLFIQPLQFQCYIFAIAGLLAFSSKYVTFLRDCPARFKEGQKWYQSIGLPLNYQRFALDFYFIRPPSWNSRKTIQRYIIQIY